MVEFYNIDVKDKVGIGINRPPTVELEVSGTVIAGKFVGDGSGLSKAGQWTDVGGGISYNAGKVGIGTTIPSANLEVNGDIKANANLVINGNVGIGATNPKEKLDVFGTIRLHGKNAFQGHDDFLRINQDNEFKKGTHFLYRANFHGGITTGTWWDVDPGERNLLVQGSVGIGTVTPDKPLTIQAVRSGEELVSFKDLNGNTKWHINQNVGGNNPGLNFAETAVADGRLFIKVGGNVGIGTINPEAKLDVAGIARAASFIPPSDAKFKTNIIPLTDVLDKLEKIRGVSFKWNELDPYGRSGGGRAIGLIAQEVEEIFPELITTWGDEGYLGIDYDRFTSVLLEAIKELKAENETFKVKIKALEDAMSKNGDT